MNKYINYYLSYLFLILFSFIHSELLHPSDNQLLYSTQILFEWDQEPNSDSYNIQISKDENFENKIIDSLVIHPFCKVQNNLNWENTYYWRVITLQESETFIIDNNIFYIGERKNNEGVDVYINEMFIYFCNALGIDIVPSFC